jgi:hypothetical protein
MKRPNFYFLSVIILMAGCVSKKKHTALKQRHEQALSEKSGLEETLNKVAVENDSLKRQNYYLDSLYRLEHEKNIAVSSKKETPKDNYVKPKASILSAATESDKKALFVYNIPNYVVWPGSVKAPKFLIGIVGESPLNAAIASHIYGKKINSLPAIVEPYIPAPGKFYHVVLVAKSKEKEFHKIKKDLQNQPVLLMTENPYLEKAGAHICFYVDGDKVKFTVNKTAIEKSGMDVGDMLLKFSQSN